MHMKWLSDIAQRARKLFGLPTSEAGSSDGNAPDVLMSGVHIDNSMSTSTLMMHCIRSLQCNILHQADDIVYFLYQGEQFAATPDNDSHTLTVWDMSWYRVPLDDMVKYADVRRAINLTNMNMLVKVFYLEHVKKKQLDVNSMMTVLFVPQIPYPDFYLRNLLCNFFKAQHYFMHKLNEQVVTTPCADRAE